MAQGATHNRHLPFFHHKDNQASPPLEGDLAHYDNPIHQQVPTTHPASDSRRSSTSSNDEIPRRLSTSASAESALKHFKLHVSGTTITGKDRHIDKAILHSLQEHNVALQKVLFQDPNIVNRRMTFSGHTNSSLLHAAARYNDQQAFTLLSQHIPDINIKSDDGFTPLHLASGFGHTDMVTYLLSHGADVNPLAQIDTKQNSQHFGEGYTPLHVAVHRGCAQTTQLLLNNGAQVDARDREGWTSLHFACRYGYLPVVQLLITHGADTSAVDNHGRSAIHFATLSGDVETVKYLISAGADLNAKASDGITPLQLAVRDQKHDVVTLLEGYDVEGADQIKHKKHHHPHLAGLGKPQESEQGTKTNLKSF